MEAVPDSRLIFISGDHFTANKNPDEFGEPVLKIENGIIRSSRIKCGCETRFPAAANLGMRTAGDYEWFREQVEDSGQFDKCRKKWYFSNERYICRACRTVWISSFEAT